jgi:hypothetical protein
MNAKEKKLLEKLRALAERGVGGEKVTATEMLDRMLKKHGLLREDLEGETAKMYYFYAAMEFAPLLFMICTNVVGFKRAQQIDAGGARSGNSSYALKCTVAEYAEIEAKMDFYSPIWELENQAFVRAFVKKHRLFDPDQTGTVDEYLEDKAEGMAGSMEEAEYQKRLNRKRDR